MPPRDLSPTSWNAPGGARLSIGLVLAAMNNDRQAIDDFVTMYSPSSRVTVNLANGANTYTIPDTTNARFVLVVMPFGNTTSCVVSWLAHNTDAVSFINPEGFYFTTLDPAHIPTTLYLFTGAAIPGVTILVF